MQFTKNVAALLFIAAPLAAQTALSLSECMQQAFQNSNVLQISDLKIDISRDKLVQSERRRMPSLTAKGSYLRIGKISSFSIPMGPGGAMREFKFGTPNRISADVSFGLPLFTWGRISSQINMAHTGVEMSVTERKQKALDVTDQVLRAYFTVLISQKAIEANRVNLERAQKNLETTKTRYENGLAPKLEMLQARVQATNARTLLDDTESALQASKIFLAKAIGREGDDITAKGELEYQPVRVDAEALIKRAFENRYDLILLGMQQHLLQGQIDIIKTSLRPTLMGIGGYSVQNGFSPMDPEEFVDNWNVGVQLSFPFFDGGVTRRRVQETQKQVATVQLQEKEIKELVAMQIRRSVVALHQAEQKYLAQKENIEFARQALLSAETQYNNGLASSLDLISAQQALSQSELAFLRALYQHTLAKIDLSKAIGDYSYFEETLGYK